MKKSQYNFTYKRDIDEIVLYNTYSKALMVLNEDEYDLYLKETYDDESRETLIENGILIEDGFDEVHFLKYMHYQAKFSKRSLHLTIAPTLDCNFDCPYCYENRKAGRMSQEIQNAVIGFIHARIDEGTRNIELSWYGGEPLLYFDIVESMSRRLKILTEKNKCSLKMYIVTNGYLLTEEIVKKMDEIGILRVQITLDGLAEHHDQSRPLRNGGNTFSKIFRNLSLFDDSPIEVVIRMNVDNRNCNDFKKLKEMIAELDNPNISLYPSPVENINKDKVNTVSEFMTVDEFEIFSIKECREASNEMIDFGIVNDRCCYCAAELENSYVIDDKGDFYKCWDEVGREENRCFNVLAPDDINYDTVLRYLVYDIFEDEKCRKCIYLPLCFGGCKFQRKNRNKITCGFTRESLIQYLESTFFQTSDRKEVSL